VPDYDVGITGLTQPPATAPVQTYYPAVAVKNYGIHPAAVTGLLRVYDKATGKLLETHNLATTADIPAGETRDVASTQPWAPTEADIGRQFIFIADVTTYRDQYEPNNHLPPTTVTVTAAPPPPPPPIAAHHLQHEKGGADTIDVTDLEGQLSDPQTPSAHKTSHQVGGTDQLNVGGLSGALAEPQTPTEHGAGKHDSTVEATANKGKASGYPSLDAGVLVPPDQLGTDVPPPGTPDIRALTLDASGPSPQRSWAPTPPEHGADKHDLTVEATANKGRANGYAPLDGDAKVPSANLPPLPAENDIANQHNILIIPVGPETEVIGSDFPPGTITSPSHLRFTLVAYLAAPYGPCALIIRVGLSGTASCTFTISAPQDELNQVIKLTSDHYIISAGGSHYEYSQAVLHHSVGGVPTFDILPTNDMTQFDPTQAHRARISVELIGTQGAHIDVCGASIARGLVTNA